VPAGLTRIASSRAGAHGKKDAGVDACGTDADALRDSKRRS